ncbi:ExeM/NucH family extracellular endonuclease [Propionibacteriaceae bacterium G1746]
MTVSLTRARGVVATAVAGALVAAGLVATATTASAAADHLLINEVYARGGSTNQPYTHKFIELYNPTSAPISLNGLSVQYRSATGTGAANAVAVLNNVDLAPGAYYVLQANSNGSNGVALPNVNQTSGLTPSGTTGTIFLVNGTTAITPTAGDVNIIDRVGYGTSNLPEGTAVTYTGANSDPGSIGRTSDNDTNDNAADFAFSSTPTPGAANSGGSTTAPPTTTPPTTPPPTTTPPAEVTPIAQIQGTGAATTLTSRVTTKGVVTATYPTGNFNGFYLQTPGSGGVAKFPGDASDGIFVYTGSAPSVTIGQCLTVEGAPAEFNGLTQLSGTPVITEATDCAPVVPTELATLPETDAAKEVYEGMLVSPKGTYTITNNYQLNQFGQLGLAFGDKPLVQATDAVPYQQAAAYEAENLKKLITLDDGSSWNYMTNTTAKNTPLPYLSQDTPMRTNSQVSFTKPVILDYRFQWNFQPTTQVVGHEVDFLTSENDRPTTAPAVGGDVKLAAFNVLNYFVDLGQDEANCKAYTDRNGTPVAANGCQVRGAYTPEAFADQQAKIVAAINGMGADVVGLMEIENSANFGHDRDHALAALVAALNAADASQGWEFVPTNAGQVPPNEDNIRLAFIYRKGKVTPVGGSLILSDPAFANARQPLAQKFRANGSTTEFIAIANHFKSKGSGEDDGTGQGLSNPSRKAQATALATWSNTTFAGEAVFLLGDFNAYTQEEPMLLLGEAGFQNLAAADEYSYQFSGRLGSLDHVLANSAAKALVAGAAIWEINGDESIAMQYSRRNYNVVDFHQPTPYASSDHDPAIVGINTTPEAPPATYPASGVFGDHDGDGIADIYVITAGGQLELWKGSATQATLLGTRGTALANVVSINQIGDWNGDKRSDALVVRPGDASLWIYTSDASGALNPWKQVGRNWQGIDVITYAGSLDGSANKYVVARNKDNHRLYRYTLTANGLTGATVIGQNWDSMKFLFSVGDFNGDGLADLMGIRASDSTLWLYLGQPNASIGYARQVGQNWHGFKAAFSPGDLNKDGRFDLVGVDAQGRMWGYTNNGRGGWSFYRQLATGFETDRLFA